MSSDLTAWVAADVAAVAADPDGHDLTDVLDTHATLKAISKAAGELADTLRQSVRDRAPALREALGKGAALQIRSEHSVASDARAGLRAVVAEPEVLAAWLAEHHPGVHDEAVMVRSSYEVDAARVEQLRLDLARSATTGDYGGVDWLGLFDLAVWPVDETIVYSDVLLKRFVARSGRLVDADGQIAPGVSVTGGHVTGIRVTPDRAFVDQLAGVIRRQVTNGVTT